MRAPAWRRQAPCLSERPGAPGRPPCRPSRRAWRKRDPAHGVGAQVQEAELELRCPCWCSAPGQRAQGRRRGGRVSAPSSCAQAAGHALPHPRSMPVHPSIHPSVCCDLCPHCATWAGQGPGSRPPGGRVAGAPAPASRSRWALAYASAPSRRGRGGGGGGGGGQREARRAALLGSVLHGLPGPAQSLRVPGRAAGPTPTRLGSSPAVAGPPGTASPRRPGPSPGAQRWDSGTCSEAPHSVLRTFLFPVRNPLSPLFPDVNLLSSI